VAGDLPELGAEICGGDGLLVSNRVEAAMYCEAEVELRAFQEEGSRRRG